MAGNPDISRIISLIMENPQLVEQISNLAKGDSQQATPEVSSEEVQTVSVSADPSLDLDRKNNTRTQLLRAMKPYLSESRGRAIDSMLSISGILDAMKRG